MIPDTATAEKPDFDIVPDYATMTSQQMIVETLNVFHGGDVVEIRALGVEGRNKRTDSGYFDDYAKAADMVQNYVRDGSTKGVYHVFNRVLPELLARASNRIETWATTTTADAAITSITWLYIDADVLRPAGISSTNDQVMQALDRIAGISEWLRSHGLCEGILSMSGNGTGLHVPLNLPNDMHSASLLKGVLRTLDEKFSDELITIDQTVSNASRLSKLYGTIARKGDSTSDRPYRMARLLHVPDYVRMKTGDVCDIGALQAVAAMSEPSTAASGSVPPLTGNSASMSSARDLRRYLHDHGVGFKEAQSDQGLKLQLEECPFNPDHKSPDSFVSQFASGMTIFSCSHDSCREYKWADFRAQIGDPKTPKTSNPVGSYPSKHGANRATADNSRGMKINCDEFIPFPIDELPPVLKRFCTEVSASVGCDNSFPAMAALAVCSAAIGTSRQLCIKYGWFCSSVIWTLLVGESGTQKSPPFRLAMSPLKARQERETDSYVNANRQYHDDLKAYKRNSKQWSKSPEGDEPESPERPTRDRCVVQDATIEALALVLNENPRGVLLARDELSGWLAGFDKYSSKSGASSEVPQWLELYNCEPLTIDRKTGDERFLYVRRPSVSICGGIQPETLSRCLTKEHRDNGLESRLLMTFPPRQAKEWRDAELSPTTQSMYSDCVRDLFELQGEDDKPATLKLSSQARSLFKAYVNLTGQEQSAMHGHQASQWSKLEEIPARLAIILHCIQQVTSVVTNHWEIDAETMQAAITLGEWFKSETLRIGRVLVEPEQQRSAKHLAKWIQEHGGKITARDLAKHRRDIVDSDVAESKLIELVDMKLGEWSGLSRSREFILFSRDLSAVGA